MIEVSAVQLTATGARRFLVFNSLAQFTSWLIFSLLTINVMSELAWLKWHVQTLNAGSLAGAVLGALPSVFLTRQARFHVHGMRPAQALAAIDARLRKRGYIHVASADGVHHYRGKLPRWLRWHEQDVRLAADAGGIRVDGPQAVLAGLRRFLLAARTA